MHCASCVSRVESALSRTPGVTAARVNLALGQAAVDAGEVSGELTALLVAAVDRAGYAAQLAEPSAKFDLEDRQRREARQWLTRLAVAGIGLMVIVAAEFLLPAGPLRGGLVLLVATGLQTYVGWPYYAGAFRLARHFSSNMDTLVALGTTAAFLSGAWHVISPWLGMLLGMVLAMAAAAAIGLPTFRLRGHYFAIATLVIGESVQIVVQRWDFIGAASGIWLPIVRENQWANFQFHDSKIPYYFIALGFLTVACLAVRHMERSKLGFYFRAIREEPEAARSLGVNITLYKSLAFMLSAAFMAMAGTFYAQYVLVVDPEVVFPLTLSILVLLMAK